jgi:hypothetical protein
MQIKGKKLIKILPITLVAITVGITMIFIWAINSKKPNTANETQTFQEKPSNTNKDSQSSTANQDNASTSTSSPSEVTSKPTEPILSKSSGNNGPVPVGVNINFVCTAEPGVDCSIVLDSGSNKVVVGPAKVTDNGRGQYFASLYWTSVKGSYKVTAQAKNIQGGVSSSIVQTLEVQ